MGATIYIAIIDLLPIHSFVYRKCLEDISHDVEKEVEERRNEISL